MINETKRFWEMTVFALPLLQSESLFLVHTANHHLEFEKAFELEDVRELLKESPGCVVMDEPANNVYPLARQAAGKDEVFIGRIRRDFSIENGLNLWVVADNIRKGAATNAVQIAELH